MKRCSDPVSTLMAIVVAGFASLLLTIPGAAAEPKTKPPAEVPTRTKTKENASWTNLFDGKTLTGWTVTDFAGHGEVEVKDGTIVLGMGQMTGITWTNEVPRLDYEISLEAMRVEGGDFFCGLTFPVGKEPCSLIVGGWGGGVVGLSSLDGQDAANNETTRYMTFAKGKWYAIRLRVTGKKIEAWIDSDKVVDAETTDRSISIRLEMESSKPLGIASYSTTAALRNIKVRRL